MVSKVLFVVTYPDAYPELWRDFGKHWTPKKDTADTSIKIIDNKSGEAIFVIRQQKTPKDTQAMLKGILDKELKRFKGYHTIVAYHESALSNISIIATSVSIPFSHSPRDEVYADCLCPLSNKKISFQYAWNYLLIGKSNYIHDLRSNILTPYMPFYYYCQLKNATLRVRVVDKEWKEILDDGLKAIGVIKKGNYLKELLENVRNNIPEKIKNNAYLAFKELSDVYSSDLSANKCKKACEDIESFAKLLEIVVNHIEAGVRI